MHKKFVLSYLFITILLLTSLSLSRNTTEKMRGSSISVFAPLWEQLLSVKHFLSNPSEPAPNAGQLTSQEEIQHLELENQLLQIEIADLQQMLHYQKKIQLKLDQITEQDSEAGRLLESHYQKALNRVISNLKWQIKALPARVIFRSFDQWNSSVWVNVGSADNEKGSAPIIGKDSPVMINQAIVGVVDYVGEHQSRVRLITDSRITPSVRAIRGGEYDALIGDYVDNILLAISPKSALYLSSDETVQLKQLLAKLKSSLQPYNKSWYLAKGELQGSLRPIGYGPPVLKGTGFNYDFADEEGEGRDLRSGQGNSSTSILKVNDVLVTTGMDGVFPPGLKVGIVSKIEFLKEGDYFYELEAKPLANNLEELSLVFVLPPFNETQEFIPASN